MADVTITELTNASLPLDGTERVPMDKAGATVDATTADIAATLPNATTSVAGKMTAADKTKLDGLGALGVSTTYTASGAIAVTDRLALVNSASAASMTLASGTTNGQLITIKRYGAGSVTITANFDGASSSILADSSSIKESILLAWSASLSTWLIL